MTEYETREVGIEMPENAGSDEYAQVISELEDEFYYVGSRGIGPGIEDGYRGFESFFDRFREAYESGGLEGVLNTTVDRFSGVLDSRGYNIFYHPIEIPHTVKYDADGGEIRIERPVPEGSGVGVRDEVVDFIEKTLRELAE